MYYVIQTKEAGYIEYVTDASDAEDALRKFDARIGIDPHDRGLSVDDWIITEITKAQYERFVGCDGKDAAKAGYLDEITGMRNWRFRTTEETHVNVSAACRRANFHRQSAIDDLKTHGVSAEDAPAVVDFVFADYSILLGGICDGRPEDRVTDEQYERLSLCRG